MTTNLVFPFALIIVCGFFSTDILLQPNSNNNTITSFPNNEMVDSWSQISQDTFPEESRSNSRESYRTNNDGKKIHLIIENGKVKKLKINGKKIAKNEYDEYANLIQELRSSNTPPTPPTPPSSTFEDAMNAHDEAMESHERAMESHRKNIEVHNRQVAKHDKAAKRNHKTSEAFANQLLRDGLISDKENFSFTLSLKKFKVDGELQNKNTREKYIRLYEQQMGKAMNSKSTYSVTHNSH
ncbi:MAG: hypothetical protein AB8H03_15950 [Saprospiraceae bacterium]